jgi:hypothetical protein
MPMIGNEYVPGPNDHHAVAVKREDGTSVVELQPGLGKDEPTPEKVNAAKIRGDAQLKELKDLLRKEAEEIEGKAEALDVKGAELNLREAELAEREKEIAAQLEELKALREAAAASSGTGAPPQ